MLIFHFLSKNFTFLDQKLPKRVHQFRGHVALHRVWEVPASQPFADRCGKASRKPQAASQVKCRGPSRSDLCLQHRASFCSKTAITESGIYEFYMSSWYGINQSHWF